METIFAWVSGGVVRVSRDRRQAVGTGVQTGLDFLTVDFQYLFGFTPKPGEVYRIEATAVSDDGCPVNTEVLEVADLIALSADGEWDVIVKADDPVAARRAAFSVLSRCGREFSVKSIDAAIKKIKEAGSYD